MKLFRCFSKDGVGRILESIYKLRCDIMASIQDLQADLGAAKASVDGLSSGMDDVLAKVGDIKNQNLAQQAQIAALQAQLAAGSPVSQADLDALDAQAKAIGDVAAQVHAKEDAAQA